MGLADGIARCRVVTPSVVLFAIAFLTSHPLVSQYVYKEVLNITDGSNATDRLIPCVTDTSSPTYIAQMKAQAKTSYILLINNFCGAIPMMVMVLFWGPLSDRWGRKPILLITYCAAFVQIILDYLTIHRNLPYYVFFIGSFLTGASGGILNVISVGNSYLTDVSTVDKRSIRIFIMEGSLMTAIGVTQFVVGVWAKATGGFDQPFAGAITSLLLGLAYTIFILPESKVLSKEVKGKYLANANDGETMNEKIPKVSADSATKQIGASNSGFDGLEETSLGEETGRNINEGIDQDDAGENSNANGVTSKESFPLSKRKNQQQPQLQQPPEKEIVEEESFSLIEVFTRSVKAFRQEDGRWSTTLLFLSFSYFCAFTSSVGGRSMEMLFLQNAPFCWDSDYLGIVQTIKVFAAFTVSIVAMVIFRKVGLQDVTIAVISTVLAVISHTLFSFAKENTQVFFAMAANLITVTFPVIRSAISKEAPSHKIGAIFAGLAFLETAANLIGNMIISPLYSATVKFFPGLSFLFMAFLEVVSILLLVPLLLKSKLRCVTLNT